MASQRCPVCGASVRAENLSKHLQSVHPRDAKPEMVLKAEREASKTVRRPQAPSLRSGLPRWVPVAVIILVLGGVGAYIVATTPASPYNSTTPVTQMCIEHTAFVRHDHAQLTITILGTDQVIPNGIGILPGCMRPVHTHQTDGTIHIESPVAHDFTLGDFFLVWGQPFSSSQILSYTASSTYEVVMTVNGAPSTAYQTYVFPLDTSTNGVPNIRISYQLR